MGKNRGRQSRHNVKAVACQTGSVCISSGFFWSVSILAVKWNLI